MANMSYCRFQNTSQDLRDCLGYLRSNSFDKELIKDELSTEEYEALLRIIEMAKTISDSNLEEE